MSKFIVVFFIVFPCLVMGNDNNITQQEFDCVIVPSNVADLGSNVPGIIGSIAVERNDFVQVGDVVATLDDKVEQATVALATQQASLTSELAFCKIKLAHAKRAMTRADKAFKNKALSLHDFDQTKVDLQLEKIKLIQAKEKLSLANKELKHAQAKLAHRTIRAPFSGVVMERLKSMGEYISNEAVIRLAQLDPLYVEVIVPVMHRGEIKVGMQAKVCANTEDNKGWNATVSQVDQVMDAGSGTYGVRLTLPNPEYQIPAGVRCDLKFLETETDVIRVTAKK